MSEKRVTIIVSDLHVGGGVADPGDDHVYQGGQFRSLIEELGATHEGKTGEIEVFVNGDFLEFAQVSPDVYQLGSSKYWCSEAESKQKLEAMLSGHADIFAAMGKFQESGNRVTIAAGNHDVDFWWPEVQKRFAQAAGHVSYELGEKWYPRYNGQLLIGHGHLFDPANTFKHWRYPIIADPYGTPRLEMCPGTLFMVKFVNWLEVKYPFSDNIKPVTALGHILWKEDRTGLAAVSWMLSQFIARHPSVALSADAADAKLGLYLKQVISCDDNVAAEFTRLYQKVRNPESTVDTVRQELNSEEAVFAFLYDVLPAVPPEEWLMTLDQALAGGSLAIGGDDTTLSILKSGITNDKEILRQMARNELEKDGGPKVVVMGHTHQPDEQRTDRGTYFNTGSWTRYVEAEKAGDLRLEDLKKEEDFPYRLNYVRVEETAPGQLTAEMICYQQG